MKFFFVEDVERLGVCGALDHGQEFRLGARRRDT